MLMVLVLCTSFAVVSRIPQDMGQYTEKMNKFQSLESMALEVYQLPEGTPKEELLSELKNRGIYYWNENLKVLAEMDSLDLPAELTLRNTKLKTYCQLRIKSYELLYMSMPEMLSQG
jgi:rhomboid protease GluP